MKYNVDYFMGLFKKKETEGQKLALALIENLEKEIERVSEERLKELQIKKELSKELNITYFLGLGDKAVFSDDLLKEEIILNVKEMIKIVETDVLSLEYKRFNGNLDEDGEYIEVIVDMKINLKN